MFEQILRALEYMDLIYEIHEAENGSDRAISLTFKKIDSNGRKVKYNIWIFIDDNLNSINLFVPDIEPLESKKRTNNIRLLEDKLKFMNSRSVYGKLEMTQADTVSFEYNFVYYDNVEFLIVTLRHLFSYIDFMVYETGILISKGVNLSDYMIERSMSHGD